MTLFTRSDFGRTLATNNDGTYHGWGNHHRVIGCAVKGGKYYGSMPSFAIGGANHHGLGRMMPTTSCNPCADTLASWFDIVSSDLGGLFPNLANFGKSNLGYV